ncbi:glycoside hydrolase family 130 protein [Rosistilla oblonga]|uniref:Beta-1,4-mannooligosaccharide phosphorylase n=1 Tax=Rosistilla oblonga TaxID=2527990 RepID=A0A518IU04_9BACT|nr:glycoside hydrolase family 130 protein [Rosistilla oblonga]QDV56565.1 Beta-1,4-mannooligosaccharide phosphorylase [Rosistilla oblonga]
MTQRLRATLLLQPSDITPSQSGWEVVGVLNPAVTVQGDDVVMLARVAETTQEQRCGWTALPRWGCDGTATVDWVCDEDLEKIDARVVMVRKTGNLRLTSVSHLQVWRRSLEPEGRWKAVALVLPLGATEDYGVEDPRITKIDNTYWITYVAVSKLGACTALMSSRDMIAFERHGIIFPSENKDVVLFPEKIDGEFVALHRPNPRSQFSRPQIWIARSSNMIDWGRHEPLFCGSESWEGDRVGSGPPPILIDEGWLLLYHGSESSKVAGKVGRYTAGAILLDRYDPSRVIARSQRPFMVPTADFETCGFVPNVVFPTAMFLQCDVLQVYYGAADRCVGMAEFSKQAVLESMAPRTQSLI